MSTLTLALAFLVFQAAPPQSSTSTLPSTNAAKPGRVKGIITYRFNENLGDKADIGSEVILIGGAVQIPPDSRVYLGEDDILVISAEEYAKSFAAMQAKVCAPCRFYISLPCVLPDGPPSP